MDKTRRLAIVRCDSHAYWYGPFLDEVDPLVLATYIPDAPTRQSVHHYGCEVGNYRKMAIRPVGGFVISKLFDRVGDRDAANTDPEALQYGTYPGRAVAFSQTFPSRPQVCNSIEEAAAGVDAAFICDSSSPKDGSDHLSLARPFLERGIPCFVDKPFASTLADAISMVELAKANGTAVMTASLLTHTATGNAFRRRFDEIGDPGLLVVKGVGHHNAAVIHGIATAHGLFGYGVESVEYMGARLNETHEHWNKADSNHYLEYLLLHYRDGREAVVMNTSHKWYPRTSELFASVYSDRGALHSPGIGDREFLSAGPVVVELFKQMIDTGQPPIPYDQVLKPIAILEAARIAQGNGQRVRLSNVWKT